MVIPESGAFYSDVKYKAFIHNSEAGYFTIYGANNKRYYVWFYCSDDDSTEDPDIEGATGI